MANIIIGTAGADALNGLSGDNTISGGAGADKVNGGAGLDTMDGGSGNDSVSGNSGDDVLVYKLAENAGSSDVYDGGSGSADVLRLDLTMSEWLQPAFQTDLANYLSFLNVNTHWKTLEASNAIFNFTAFGLAVSKVEYVEVYVDGVKLSAENNNVALGADTMSAGENAAGISANLFLNDSVLDQVLTFSNTGAAHGSVVIATDFSAVNNPEAVATYTPTTGYWDYLAVGETGSDSFTYTVTDADGQIATQTVTVTIIGANDAPVITPVLTGVGVSETNTTLTADGSVTVFDVDASDTVTLTVDGVSRGGTGSTPLTDAQLETMLTVDADGAWHFNSGAEAFDNLPAGKTVVLSYVIKADDGHTGTDTETVTVTITGTNDAAEIGAPLSAAVTEDLGVNGAGQLTATGTLSISDPDDDEASFQTTVTSEVGNLGALTLAANGAYTYAVSNAAAQYLGAGDTKVDKFTVSALDGTTKEISFTVTGVNDAAVIGDPTIDDVTEDGPVNGLDQLTATGSIAISDDDAGEASFNTTVQSDPGNLGTLTLAADGSYTYAVANSLTQSLGQGATKVDTFTVTATDGTTQEASFTITGVNDAPVFVSGGTGTVAENSPIATVVYDATVTDVDGGAMVFSLSGTDAGKFDIDGSTGEVTFKVSPDYETPTDDGGDNVYDVTVNAFDGTDTTAQAVAITVTNVNESPTIASNGGGATATISVPENTTAVTIVTATDPDAPTTFTYSLVGGDEQAKFTINASGQLSFITPPDFEAPTDTAPTNSYQVTVRVSDGTLFDDQVITVNVTNVNEADPNDFDGFSGGSTGAGTNGSDTLRGATGNDSISAGNGMDLVYGLAGNDTIAGGNDADTIYGGSGNDSILAGPDTDWIYGGSGNDTIQGDNGTDFIAGGYGADMLTGNQNVTDTFMYYSLDDSTLFAFDSVTDFSSGSDKIDLTGIDADTTTVGNQDFNDTIYTDGLIHGPGTLYFNTTTKTLLGDVDGDGVADLKIQLQATASLGPADIIG